MNWVWKGVIVAVIVIAGYWLYQGEGERSLPAGAQTAASVDSPSSPMSSTGTAARTAASPSHHTSTQRDEPPSGGIGTYTGIDDAEDALMVEEEIVLNKETGQLVIKDPETGEVLMETFIDEELIHLVDLEALDMPQFMVDKEALKAQAEQEVISVYSEESADQAPEQLLIKEGDGYEAIPIDPNDQIDITTDSDGSVG